MKLIIVTHAMRFAKEVSNKVVFIHDGELVKKGLLKNYLIIPKLMN